MNEVNATGKIRQQNPDEIITANVRIADRLIAARKNKTSLQIHYKDKSYSGIFSKINSDNIVLLTEKVMPFDFTDTDVLVEFDLEDCHYSLETTIIISSSREVLLTPPVKMLVFTTRTRERIDVRNKIFIKFSVIAQPESLAAIDAAASKPSAILRAIYAEIAKNEIDLPTVFRLVQKELAKFSHSAAIKLKRKNENYDLAANLVLQYKKPLYIIKASDMASWLRPLTDNGFISFLPFYQRVKEIGWTPEQIKDHLHILVETYAKKNIGSLLIMPILLFGNVAGWIRLLHRSPLAYNIEKISQIEECTALITEAVLKNYLFNIDSAQDFSFRAMDLSEKGMLFSASDPFLLKYLHLGTVLKITLRLDENEKIIVEGAIRRFEELSEGKNIGIEFTNISLQARVKIQKYLETLAPSFQIDELLKNL